MKEINRTRTQNVALKAQDQKLLSKDGLNENQAAVLPKGNTNMFRKEFASNDCRAISIP